MGGGRPYRAGLEAFLKAGAGVSGTQLLNEGKVGCHSFLGD